MPPKNEICRYFQRGSCQYGTRCKFLHPTPQQTQTNPFGFGKQTGNQFQDTRQPVPNPFGFGSKSNQPKPFENKWSRFSPINNSSASASRQPDNQPKAANHRCTDPESCKRVMLEDLRNEKPLWNLTCYGHSPNGPCDIAGDISYDELRALAYDDYKHGKSLQAIVERERNMLNSKITEFENLVQKPYTVSSASTPSSQNLFAGVNKIAPFANTGSSAQVSSFSQLSASLNTRSAAAPSYDFGQASAFQSNSQPSSTFQMNNSPFNSSGTFVSQPQQSIQSAFPFDTTKPSNGGSSLEQNPFSAFANSSPSAIGQSITGIQSINTIPKENTNVDGSIWTKPEWKWNVGEIPEEAPPDIYIR